MRVPDPGLCGPWRPSVHTPTVWSRLGEESCEQVQRAQKADSSLLSPLCFHCALSPHLSIQRPQLHGFADVIGGDTLGAGQVGNRPRDLEDPVVGTGAQAVIGHRHAQQFEDRIIERAMGLEIPIGHPGVAGDPRPAAKALKLALTGGGHAFADAL